MMILFLDLLWLCIFVCLFVDMCMFVGIFVFVGMFVFVCSIFNQNSSDLPYRSNYPSIDPSIHLFIHPSIRQFISL